MCEVQTKSNDSYYEELLTSLLRITGSILIEFVSCSRDLYNLMHCGIISNWNDTFSRNTLLKMYSNQTDIIKRYDNFSINLLGHNINIKDQFTIWKIQILDINNTDLNDINIQTLTHSILFILSYISLIEHYNIKYGIPQIKTFLKIKTIQSTSTIFECAIHLKHLKEFIQNVIKLNNNNNNNNNNINNHSSSYYHNIHQRDDNGEIEQFDCKLMDFYKFDQLINEINGINGIDDNLLRLLKNELFLPNLINFNKCWLISIYIRLFEQLYFGHYPRKLKYTACCIKLESKKIKKKYIQSFLVWNGVLIDIVGVSILNKLQFNNASFLNT